MLLGMHAPRRSILLVPLLALAACAAPRPAPVPVEAEGTLVRHRRVRLAPYHTQDFEAVLRACVAGAEEDGSAAGWLCYRESPGRYWLVTFASEDGELEEPPGLEGFVETFAPEALDDLRALELEVEWEWELQQAEDWSTVREMSTDTHPKARMMLREVRPGREAEFAAALTARTAFLAEHGYPLPIEGFVMRRGDASLAVQVVFPRDWSSFHGAESFGAFIDSLDGEARAEYARRKAALMETMSRAKFLHASFAPELSHAPG